MPRYFFLTVAILSLSAALGAQTQDQNSAPATSAQPTSSAAPSKDSNYVGAETCKTCHEDIYNDYAKSPHSATEHDAKRGPRGQGCEACHGPGKEHAESADPTKIFTFKNASAKDASERCLTCHALDTEHNNFARAAHMQNNVGCIQCHSPHHPKVAEHLLREKQPQLCYGCHLETKQQFDRPFHHRVNEGLVQCNDCHNPHGGFMKRQLRSTAAQDAVCFKCHTEKQGPFVYEHPPVKTEGCISCHTPHGSSNPRLLNVSQVNMQCLQCHAFTVDPGAPATPTFHNQAQKYQACTLCHTQIHGSNFDPDFFK